ncbi:GIY-YIG nuclease family protein [Anaerovorax odorimutans]|uniref:GIY-YIG nuclease family protein n=1 Tax=Anaerovorax odorimutans TaxID=109327 RepID=UPI00041B1EDE|nr:GIY-YIG nuclease family protein [Anaerovorax odorimutans]
MKKTSQKLNYVYLLRCKDGTLYGGWTNDLQSRIKAHNDGKGAKYTRGRRPVTLVYSESFDTKEEAMKMEWKIKHMARAKKIKLIEEKGKGITINDRK